MVLGKLHNLISGRSTGPDGWHPYFLSSLADILSTPLKMLFNKSLCEGIVPIQWFEACITAIHKKRTKKCDWQLSSCQHYLCDMQNDGINYTRSHYRLHNNYIAEEQHGFVPRRECMIHRFRQGF